jgi:hypothetical protein
MTHLQSNREEGFKWRQQVVLNVLTASFLGAPTHPALSKGKAYNSSFYANAYCCYWGTCAAVEGPTLWGPLGVSELALPAL